MGDEWTKKTRTIQSSLEYTLGSGGLAVSRGLHEQSRVALREQPHSILASPLVFKPLSLCTSLFSITLFREQRLSMRTGDSLSTDFLVPSGEHHRL